MALFNKPTGNDALTESDNTGGIKWITERHVACVFVLDTSGSMTVNDAIGKLNEGIRTFKQQTMSQVEFDEHTKACIDVAFVTFGPDVKMVQDFMAVSDMTPPTLTAGGMTPLGGALNLALDMITQHKARYNELGTPYYRPWVFCITDGEPNDEYEAAARRLKQMEQGKKVLGYCVGVESFNEKTVATIFDHERIFKLENLNFPALFKFLSNSLAVVRNSDGGDTAGGSVKVDAPGDLHKITLSI